MFFIIMPQKNNQLLCFRWTRAQENQGTKDQRKQLENKKQLGIHYLLTTEKNNPNVEGYFIYCYATLLFPF